MFNWWTFLLEVVNFLILVYILKRLLYGPIVGVIRRRHQVVQEELADIERQRSELAEASRRQEEALSGMERERGRIVAEARAAADAERLSLLAVAREEARREQERQRSALAGERGRVLREVQGQVAEAALAVSGRLLEELAGQTLDGALTDLGLRRLSALPPEEAGRAMRSLPEPKVGVVSARPLSPARRAAFERALAGLPGPPRVEFGEDASLAAGVRVEVGELILNATLAAQLDVVREIARAALEQAAGGEAEA